MGAQDAGHEVERILTEMEVFLKYGLKDRAINHIQQVFDIDPLNIVARERLKDLLVEIVMEAMAMYDCPPKSKVTR